MPTYPKLETRSATCALIDAAENGMISWEDIARECLEEMSEQDVEDMCRLAFDMELNEEED